MNYKPQPKSARRKARGNTLLGIFIGLAIGLIVAVGIALYVSKMPSPFGKDADKSAQPKPAQNAEAPDKPQKTEEKRFDFYRILPGQEVPVSEKELQQARSAAKSSAQKEPYLIQAGAFQSPADADAMKARLALLGLEASVEPAHLPDKGTLYRVRLGPYTDLDEINKVRQSLSDNGIQASLVKSRKE